MILIVKFCWRQVYKFCFKIAGLTLIGRQFLVICCFESVISLFFRQRDDYVFLRSQLLFKYLLFRISYFQLSMITKYSLFFTMCQCPSYCFLFFIEFFVQKILALFFHSERNYLAFCFGFFFRFLWV